MPIMESQIFDSVINKWSKKEYKILSHLFSEKNEFFAVVYLLTASNTIEAVLTSI